MESTFKGFSDDDVKRIQSGSTETPEEEDVNLKNIKKIDTIGSKYKKRVTPPYKLQINTQISDDNIDNITFEKCKLSLKTPTPDILNNNGTFDTMGNESDNNTVMENLNENIISKENFDHTTDEVDKQTNIINVPDLTNDINSNYTENELIAHKAKLEDLQLRHKLMEEQNKKRKEMLAKALDDRTKQTENEVNKLQKIKQELQVLDGQLSQDVSMLRKKIDQACITYSEAEKVYLKVEKEFLQAKLNLQKEKEKKELLTEHLCTLITHNETRKAKKLETLMFQLAYEVNEEEQKSLDNDLVEEVTDHLQTNTHEDQSKSLNDSTPVIVDGVDEKTGKFVDINLG